MDRRKAVIALIALGATPFTAIAQQHSKVFRIGFLGSRSRSTPSNPDVYVDAFVEGLRELGYIDGKNIVVEWRFADGKYERLAALAAELVKLNPDILVTHATPPALELHRATRTIPIVVTSLIDPIGSGLAASLARPGGNITGLSNMTTDLSNKQIDLMREALPRLKRLGILVNLGTEASARIIKNFQKAVQKYGLTTMQFDARTSDAIERAFAAFVHERVDAVIVASDSFFVGQRTQIAQAALERRLASMTPYAEHAKAGSLMSYGPDNAASYRRGATYVDKILKGAKPSDLPIEQPTKVELVINLKTAKALGITIPQTILLRADRVIE